MVSMWGAGVGLQAGGQRRGDAGLGRMGGFGAGRVGRPILHLLGAAAAFNPHQTQTGRPNYRRSGHSVRHGANRSVLIAIGSLFLMRLKSSSLQLRARALPPKLTN